MPKFTPIDKKELQALGLLQRGQYPFTVKAASDATSKKSNTPMIALEMLVYGDDNPSLIRDYLVFSDNKFCQKKISEFCGSVGLDYTTGEVNTADCEGRSGLVEIKIEQDDEKKYPPKNVVAWYEAKDGATNIVATSKPEPDLTESEDSIPF